jgi:hypothetical protein
MKIDRPDSFLLLERSKKEEGRGRWGGEDEKKGEKGNENRWTEFSLSLSLSRKLNLDPREMVEQLRSTPSPPPPRPAQ